MNQAPNEPTAATSGDAPSGGLSARLIVFLVVFIDLLGFGIVLPLLPIYAEELLQPLFPGREKLHGAILGLLMASFSAMQFFFAPLWGRVSDRVGRRPILLLGLTGSAVFYALFGVASELGTAGHASLALALLFVARLGAGIAGATISTAQAVIADTTPPEQRARGMALIGIAFGVGFTFGPLLGFASLFVPREGSPGFLAALLSFSALVLGFLLMPETARAGPTSTRPRRLTRQGFRLLLEQPTLCILVLTFFLATFAFGSLESTLALVNKMLIEGDDTARRTLTRAAARSTERGNFLVFAYVGFVLMLAQGLLYRRFVRRVGEVRFLRTGMLLMVLGLLGALGVLFLRQSRLAAGEATGHLLAPGLAVMTVAVMGFAFLTPSVQSLVSRHSDASRQGEVLGINQAGSALARILGPMMGLSLYGLTPSHGLPFAFGAALLVVAGIMSRRISDPKREGK